MKKLFLLLLALLPMTMLAQRYEGEKNKKGEPDGQGTMYFEYLVGDVTYAEKLEGTFKKGDPVIGKSFRYIKDSGRPLMSFEGKFKLKEKGVFRKLSDLIATGNIVFYFYENSQSFDECGYQVSWGEYDGKTITNGCIVSSLKKQMCYKRDGRWGSWTSRLTPEAMKYLEELKPLEEAAIAKAEQEEKNVDWSSLHKLKYVTKDKKIEIYDFANKVYGMNYQNRFLDNIIGSKSYLLNKPLTAPRVPRFINIFSQMFVEMALNGEHHWNMCIDVVSMLKSLPAEIRDGVIKKEGVKLDSAGTKVSSVREAIFYAATKSDRFYDYYAIYRDYGSMTQQEIENYEDVCILKGMREDYYKDRFPNGRYLGKDLDEVWVQVYINRVKAMLEANNKTLFTGTNNAELKRNMMVPMLSRSMGGHNEETSGVISFFIKTRPIFAFNQDAYMEEIAKSWNRINNKYKKPAGYEDAKLFRTLIDGIAIANIISYDSWQSRLQNSLEYWMGIQRMRIDEIEDETIQAARTLSAKYPSIKPACLKAESHIKEQFGRFEKLDAEVSPRHREELARIIKERRATNCKNCKVNGSQTTFPSGWKEEWSFLFFEIEPAQSKTSGRIVLLNGKEIEWKYVQSSGEKTKVKASGYINGTYDSVNEMITAFIVKCKNEYCD